MYANALCLATARAALQDIFTREGYQRVKVLGAQLADGIERGLSSKVGMACPSTWWTIGILSAPDASL